MKNELRLKYSELRNGILPELLLHSSLTIANSLLELPIWQYDNYHIFLPIPNKNEVDTSFILSILQGKDKNIILPKVATHEELKHYLLTDNTKLICSDWGVPEPEGGIEMNIDTLEVVFVPLLAFDLKGNRIGYGKGYYDRFLSKCKPGLIKIGLSMFEAEDEIFESSEFDIPLTYCVTPKKTYSFN